MRLRRHGAAPAEETQANAGVAVSRLCVGVGRWSTPYGGRRSTHVLAACAELSGRGNPPGPTEDKDTRRCRLCFQP